MAQENLNINIRAFDKTKGAFNSLARNLGGVKKAIFSVQGALVGLGAGVGLRELSSGIDELAKQSARLGLTVAQLQSLQFAASQSGTGAAELSKGFEKFNKSISEAASGIGTGVTAFKALGVTLTNNDGSLKSTEQLLNEVADGFTGIQNPADRVRIAMDLFGRSGAGMVNMLQNGSGELSDIRGEFAKLTVELTGEQAMAVEQANDLFDKLGRTFTSIAQQVTAAVMPALANLAAFLTRVMLQSVARVIDNLNSFINTWIGLYNAVASRVPGLDEMQEVAFGQAASERLKEIAKNYEDVTGEVQKVTQAVEQSAEGIIAQETPLQKANKALKDYAENAKEVKANLADAALRGVNSLTDSLADVVTGTKSAKEAFKSMAASIVNDLVKIMIQQQITGVIAGALGNMGFFGGKPVTASSGNAIGGSVQRGVPTLVGERGAELFVPNQSGSIIPNNKMGGSGVTVNQTINISTGVQQTVRAEIAQLMPQIANASKAAVLDARRRGGNFAGAFGS